MPDPIILLIEDNVQLNEINRRALESEGCEVLSALTLNEARKYLASTSPDIILLDVMMPDGNGIDFCVEIRSDTDAHILFLTSKQEHESKIRGLEMGGDDYITKPFKLDEMLSRVRSVLRRRAMKTSMYESRNITKGVLTMDTLARHAFINGVDMLLSPKEFSLLLHFVQNEGKLLTAHNLYEAVWNQPIADDKRALQIRISSLRTKLANSGFNIVSAYGKGYAFVNINNLENFDILH